MHFAFGGSEVVMALGVREGYRTVIDSGMRGKGWSYHDFGMKEKDWR